VVADSKCPYHAEFFTGGTLEERGNAKRDACQHDENRNSNRSVLDFGMIAGSASETPVEIGVKLV